METKQRMRNKTEKGNRLAGLGAVLLLLMAAVCLSVRGAALEPDKTVRVGVYPLENFHAFDDRGVCTGYDVDYLQEIHNYTGWTYEYVRADSWSGAIEMLRDGQIDLLAPSQITTDRLSEFSFSSFPIGKVYAAILEPDTGDTVYEDFEAFGRMEFGIEEGNTYSAIFTDYARNNGFEPHVRYYANQTELEAALHAGEVDAIVVNIMRAASDMRLIGKAGAAQYYYMYRKDDPALGDALNQALDQLEISDPGLQQRLIDTYFPIYNVNPFTKAELDYIESLPTLRVACNVDNRPFSYLDENGRLTGIAVDYLTRAAALVGKTLEFVPTPLHPEQDYMQAQRIDLSITSANHLVNKSSRGESFTDPFLTSQEVVVCAPGVQYSAGGELTMAFPDDGEGGAEALLRDYPGVLPLSCASVEDCFAALRDGRADCSLVNQYAQHWYGSMPQYADLVLMPDAGVQQELCLQIVAGAQLSADDVLSCRAAFNKLFDQQSAADTEQLIIGYTNGMPYQLTMGDLCYQYRVPLLIILALVLVLVGGVVQHLRTTNRHLAQISTANGALEEKNGQLSAAIVRAEKASKSKSDFLARMSHEIRTPMNAIIGETAIAQVDPTNAGRVAECLKKTMTASRHLLALINDILDMSALESDKIHIAHVQFDLKEVVSTVCTLYYSQCRTKGVRFHAKMHGLNTEMLVGDQLRLQQCILNLLSNAVKFTPAGGEVVFDLTETKQEDDRVELTVRVSDTGCGMSEEYMQRIFKPFEQESSLTAKEHGGSGLGLSITKSLVELMGGTIHVESSPDKGTTFMFTVSCAAAPDQKALDHAQISSMRAIVVDDDADALDYVDSILNHIGIEHDCASGGEQALQLITKARNDRRMYNLCLVDWQMADMDGLELTRRIRQSCGENPVVVIASAYDLNEVSEQTTAAGVDACIAKPLFQSTMFNLLMSLSQGRLVNDTAQKEDYDFTGRRLLLVDDTELNREIAVSLLEMVGFVVDTAEDGEQGVRAFNAAAPGTYDAVLMDVQMPVMNGYEATRAIRAGEHPDAQTVPIIAMTANAFAEDIAKSLESGMNDHVSKPIDTELLYEVLSRYMPTADKTKAEPNA